MELDALASFLVLVEERHFGRAAERCNMSRSTLSRQMQKLERAFRTPLLDRTSQRVKLTPAGEKLAARGTAVVTTIEELIGDVRSAT
jgi:DNA-binding transcriptional LysR family regulator